MFDSDLVPLPVEGDRLISPAGPYSAGMVWNGVVFVAGQRPVRPHDGSIPEGFQAQALQALDNIQEVLQAIGSKLEDILKITVYVADLSFYDELNSVFRKRLRAPFPARTTVGVRLRNVLVEMDAFAIARGPAEAHLALNLK